MMATKNLLTITLRGGTRIECEDENGERYEELRASHGAPYDHYVLEVPGSAITVQFAIADVREIKIEIYREEKHIFFHEDVEVTEGEEYGTKILGKQVGT